MKLLLIAALFALAISLPALAQDAPDESAPASYEPKLFEESPGILFYMFQDDALWHKGLTSCDRRATPFCITDPVAMNVFFYDVDGPSGFMELDLDQALPATEGTAAIPLDTIGLSIFVKGDGSDNAGLIELRTDYRAHGSAFEFPLSDSTWRHLFIKWSDFSPAPDVSQVASLSFGLKANPSRLAHYTIDRILFVTAPEDPAVLAALAEKANAVTSHPAPPSRPALATCTHNKDSLAKARAKLREGKPVKLLAYGDSVTVPVQQWNLPEDMRVAAGYHHVAARTLEKEFSAKIDVVVNAIGGRHLNEDFQSLIDSVNSEKPDVLLLLTGDNIENYKRLLPAVLSTAAETGAEVLVITPTYEGDYMSPANFDWLLQWCLDNKIACADARKYLLAVTKPYFGDYVANPSHPNVRGHKVIAEVVAEMFR